MRRRLRDRETRGEDFENHHVRVGFPRDRANRTRGKLAAQDHPLDGVAATRLVRRLADTLAKSTQARHVDIAPAIAANGRPGLRTRHRDDRSARAVDLKDSSGCRTLLDDPKSPNQPFDSPRCGSSLDCGAAYGLVAAPSSPGSGIVLIKNPLCHEKHARQGRWRSFWTERIGVTIVQSTKSVSPELRLESRRMTTEGGSSKAQYFVSSRTSRRFFTMML